MPAGSRGPAANINLAVNRAVRARRRILLGSDRTNSVTLAEDLRTDSRWPQIARAIVDSTPARGFLSCRLFLSDRNRAGLNQ